MKIFGINFGKKVELKPEHAVIVNFDYGNSTDLTRLFNLEEDLESALDGGLIGEYDGNEIATDGSDGFLYLYGPDADALYNYIRPILLRHPFTNGARIKLRYGPPEDGVRVVKFILESD